MTNRISNDELRRIVAQQELLDFRCPECGHSQIKVSAALSVSIDLVNGTATRLRSTGFSQEMLSFSCRNQPVCTWESDSYTIEADGNEYIPAATADLFQAAIKDAFREATDG